MENFLFILSEIASFSVGSIIFLSGISYIFVLFILFLLLAIFKSNFTYKNRSFFILNGILILAIEKALFYNNANIIFYYASVISIIFFSIPLFSIRVKVRQNLKFDDKQLELARYFDNFYSKNLAKAQENTNSFLEKKAKAVYQEEVESGSVIEQSNVIKTLDKVEQKMDFSHVKNIINRLNTLDLAPYDKKKVKELESAILFAQNCNKNLDRQTKEKINLGLGALIKIVAKYNT